MNKGGLSTIHAILDYEASIAVDQENNSLMSSIEVYLLSLITASTSFQSGSPRASRP